MQPPDQPQARLIDARAFPGFRLLSRVGRVPDDPQARVVTLRRRSKKRAAAFFERWREALKWQRLKPYEAFAEMIERRAYGMRDEEYLRLKILTCQLPEL